MFSLQHTSVSQSCTFPHTHTQCGLAHIVVGDRRVAYATQHTHTHTVYFHTLTVSMETSNFPPFSQLSLPLHFLSKAPICCCCCYLPLFLPRVHLLATTIFSSSGLFFPKQFSLSLSFFHLDPSLWMSSDNHYAGNLSSRDIAPNNCCSSRDGEEKSRMENRLCGKVREESRRKELRCEGLWKWTFSARQLFPVCLRGVVFIN